MTRTLQKAATLGAGGASETASAMADLSRALCEARTLDQVTALVSHSVRALLHADGGSFVLRDGDRCFYADEDAVSPLWKGRRFPMKACISGWSMTHRQAAAIPDIYQDPRIPVDAYRPTFVRSLLMVPVGPGAPVAALGAYWADKRQPGPEDIEQLQTIADAAALALARLKAPQSAPGAGGRPDPGAAPGEQAPPRPREAAFAPGALKALFARVRRNGLRRNSPEAYGFAVLSVIVATIAREGFRAIGADALALYATYYPAVLAAKLVGGGRPAILAAALGGLAADFFFMPPLYRFAPPSLSGALDLTLYLAMSALIIVIIASYRRAVLRLRQEDARHLTLAREQGHRLTNAVAVVDSVVRQSLRDQPERAGVISRRIRAGLKQIEFEEQDDGGEQARTLRELLSAELEPYDLARFALQGEDALGVGPRARSILSLVVHELATNAAKYGALSVPDGRVSVTWTGPGSDGRAIMVWAEAGGPPVHPPRRRGYGSTLLQRLVQSAGGAYAVDFRPGGVTAELSLALSDGRGG